MAEAAAAPVVEPPAAAPAAPAPAPAAAPAAPAPAAAPKAGDPPAAPAASVENMWPDDWRTRIAGDDGKVLKRLERYATPKEVAFALTSVQERINAGELRSSLPKNATVEQINQWRTENGIPEAPEKYALKLKDGLVIGENDKPIIEAMLKVAHGKNVSNEAASAVVDWYYDEVTRQTQERQAKDVEFARTTEEALRTEWGAEYKLNTNMIKGLVDMAPEGVRELLMGARLGNGDPMLAHPDAMRWLVGMAREINPVTALVPNATGTGMVTAIEDEIKQIQGWMGAPKGSPDHKKYWEDPKMSGPNGRYYQLLDAKSRMDAKK
ncbi:hypothetical protein UFOVP1670_19 [uncultured Caudovirales phage]|uniref:Uncharacterized protein n=1 Tax=uncultured Caudovirales phage TaxID=2100421 RepID=A0A6J5T6G3_9CAUD|nr:hypothetical protein UFOVP1670_19 [uncultured Caudovirales phage]